MYGLTVNHGLARQTPWNPVWLLPVLILGLCQAGCSGLLNGGHSMTAGADAEIAFATYEVATGKARHQTVLTGFLLDGPIADLAMVQIEECGNRRLCIYSLTEGTWTLERDALLNPTVLCVDVCRIDGRDRLLTYAPSRLAWFDPDTSREHSLVEMATAGRPTNEQELPWMDVTRDLNRDGRVDLVTHTLEGRSLLKLRSRMAVHYGQLSVDGPRFARSPSTTLHPQGATAMGYQMQELRDIDGDGAIEIVHVRVDTGIGNMMRALVANSIALDIAVYRLTDGVYPDKPCATRKIRPDLAFFNRNNPYFPTVLSGDVNGDGRADLLAGQSRKELRVYPGVTGPGLITKKPHKVAVALTANERNARVVDLNGDAKEDVLVHHPSATAPHRVVTLLAR